MCRAVDVQQMLDVHLRVPLRRRQLDVSEQFLDGTKIGAAFEEVGGKRVAQGVGADAVARRAE